MKILITGGAGFIGFHLSKDLIPKGHSIVTLDNINDYYDVNIKYARLYQVGIGKNEIKWNKCIKSTQHSNYRFIQLDLTDRDEINNLFASEKFDVVINLAAQAGVRYSIENPHTYSDSNIAGFLNILEACRNYPVNHLLYASSSSVYGNSTQVPFTETDRVDEPVSLYAATKKANELMAHTYSYLYGIPASGLRFFTVYGPWGRPDMAYFKFTQAILEGHDIDIFNHGDLRRDFTYIDDIVAGIAALVDKGPQKTHQVYNIGNNKPIRLMDFVRTLEDTLGTKAKLNMLPMQAGDVFETYADTSKLYAHCGFNPHTGIKEGLMNFVSWYRSYYKIG